MAVCNAQLSFTNVVSKWLGSVHDSAAFNRMFTSARGEGRR